MNKDLKRKTYYLEMGLNEYSATTNDTETILLTYNM